MHSKESKHTSATMHYQQSKNRCIIGLLFYTDCNIYYDFIKHYKERTAQIFYLDLSRIIQFHDFKTLHARSREIQEIDLTRFVSKCPDGESRQ